MLKSLFIRNFVLIDSLDIKFDKGFSVITGETGAGKSIILGALSLVLGQRADGKSIKNGSEKCVIEAVFDVSRYKLEEFFLTNDLGSSASTIAGLVIKARAIATRCCCPPERLFGMFFSLSSSPSR